MSSKHLPPDGVVHALNKYERCKCLTYWGGDRTKCMGTVNVFKKDENNSLNF